MIDYDKYENMIYKIANKYTAETLEFDDLVQEFGLVFLTCQKHFDDSKGKFSTYLWVSCVNKANELRRKNYTHNTLSLDYDLGNEYLINYIADDYDLEVETLQEFQVDDIVDLLKSLPNGDYSLLYLFGGMNQEEIAQLKGVSRSYVHKIHHDNLKQLERKFKKE